ncbi:hypothetical protein K2173_004325 [Erythroxylum novogranatense]|uniref:Dof zinc finger protein n=1 Tax=Erythroxylum novogranatense TaxID=1862640 RepID=A0AAV8T641_9ROSI|nr:hypothetical protein K2173_004325 [Erythroxylum novogranatense]
MGLSSMLVSSDHGIDWSQTLLQAQTLELELPKPPQMRRQQGQQSDPLKCPRCDSINTKFCYYNNYNKSQPRHFCKNCKRHWTKGGTLRNVPIGGGRKNKRLKTTKTDANSITSTTTNTITTTAITSVRSIHNGDKVKPKMVIRAETQKQNLPLALVGRKDICQTLDKSLISPVPSSGLQQSSFICSKLHSANSDTNNAAFIYGSELSLPQNQGLNFSYSSTSSSFNDAHPSSISTSFQPPIHAYNYSREAMDDSTITNVMYNSSSCLTQPWLPPNASSSVDMATYRNWEDIDTFTSDNLNVPWDDSDIKP